MVKGFIDTARAIPLPLNNRNYVHHCPISKLFHASFNTTKTSSCHSQFCFLLFRALSAEIWILVQGRRTIPLAGNKIVLSSSKMSTCAWWSSRIIYFSRRDTKGCTDETKVNPFPPPSLSLSLSSPFLPWKASILFCFPSCTGLYAWSLESQCNVLPAG